MGNQNSNQQQKAGGGTSGSSTSGSSSTSAASSQSVNYTSTQGNGTGTMTQARKPPMTAVKINVYEPSKPQASMPGFGIYHTGIEVNGVEYCFAGAPEASGTGVQSQVPRATPEGGQWKFMQTIELGFVTLSSSEFEKILNEMRDAFPANTYDLIHRNCNHFSKTVAKRLGVEKNYPSWINRAASWGSVFVAPPKGHKPIELPPPKESVFKTTTGHRLDGGSVAPKGKKEEKKSNKPEEKKSNNAAGRKNPWADEKFAKAIIEKSSAPPLAAAAAAQAAQVQAAAAK